MTKWGEAFVGNDGQPINRKIGRFEGYWMYLTDPMFRKAVKTKREIEDGKTVMHAIGEVNGMKVMIPETMLVGWNDLPEEARVVILSQLQQAAEGESSV